VWVKTETESGGWWQKAVSVWCIGVL